MLVAGYNGTEATRSLQQEEEEEEGEERKEIWKERRWKEKEEVTERRNHFYIHICTESSPL